MLPSHPRAPLASLQQITSALNVDPRPVSKRQEAMTPRMYSRLGSPRVQAIVREVAGRRHHPHVGEVVDLRAEPKLGCLLRVPDDDGGTEQQ